MLKIEITQVSNGYIYKVGDDVYVYSSTESLFERLLLSLEGRANSFTGERYGYVIIQRKEPDLSTLPDSE